MKNILLILVLTLLASGTASAGQPKKLTVERIQCNEAGDYYSLLVRGEGTFNQSIEWSPDKKFTILGNEGYSGVLEGDSGALAFSVYGGASSGISEIAYPNGVWFRWKLYPKVVTHVSNPC